MSDEATIRARKTIRDALVLVGFMLLGTLALTLANRVLGWIDSDTTTRGVMVLIGLMLVVTGNGMPKKQEGPPPQTVGDIATRQSVLRVGGWALLLGGVVWIVLWIFAPRDIATTGSIAAVGASTLVMLGYTIWRYRRGRSASR